MLDDILGSRRLPPLPDHPTPAARREALLDHLATEVYGRTPGPIDPVVHVHSREESGWGGKARVTRLDLEIAGDAGSAIIPVVLVVPHIPARAPLAITLTFDPYPSGEDIPVEEVIDRGWAVAAVQYTDVAPDAPLIESGLAGAFHPQTPPWGRIAMWAYAISRVADVAIRMPEIDPRRIVAVGHSRLGKTALWAAAQDTRLAAAVAHQSGSTGAALARGKRGERIAQITASFPHWFTPAYAQWANREEEMPHDAHFLIAAIAPRLAYVSSAADDTWADPVSEFLGGLAASPAWQDHGRRGVHGPDRMPLPGERRHEGHIGYHLRTGAHFHSRDDWMAALDFLDRRFRDAQPATGAGPVEERTTSSGSNSSSLSA